MKSTGPSGTERFRHKLEKSHLSDDNIYLTMLRNNFKYLNKWLKKAHVKKQTRNRNLHNMFQL